MTRETVPQPSPRPIAVGFEESTIATPAENAESGWAFFKVLWKHRKILACCTFANIGAAMYGFDNLTLSLCLSMQPFVEEFGALENGTYAIPAYWQSLWNALSQVATAMGCYAAGPISDRFGRRLAFLVAAIISAAGVAVVYTSSSPGQFLGGKMVNALGLGLAITAGQTYVSEITPTAIRGVALSAFTMSMNLGYMIAASVAFTRISIPDRSGYKLVFAAEWIWPGLLLLGLPLIPESPYYLVRNGKMESAARSLRKLHDSSDSIDPVLQAIKSITDHESYIKENASFRECFRGINWRRTRIVLYANGLSQMLGATFMSNAPYFMIVAGMSATSGAMLVELGIGLAIISSAFSFWAMTVFGRRTMILSGTAFAGALFLIMGIASSIPNQSTASLWCVGISLQLVWLSIGPAIGPAMALAGELSAVKLRAQTLAIGFLFNYTFSTIFNVVVPYMFNTDAGNLGGKMGWIFFGTSVIAVAIVWFEFPETKGLSFAQIEDRFEMRVEARQFTKYHSEVDTTDVIKASEEQVEYLDGKDVEK
ncbi:maltose permease Mal61 [Ilyonectria destructans]|nr:maltose permease Mal61 [Ilyonectria destructans]